MYETKYAGIYMVVLAIITIFFLIRHFEVDPRDAKELFGFEQYLRKATAFAQNLRGARKAHILGATLGVIIWTWLKEKLFHLESNRRIIYV